MSKLKELGYDQGIRITRPWNTEMYEHNDRVSELKKERVLEAFKKAYALSDKEDFHTIAKIICGHGFGVGYPLRDIYTQCLREVEVMASWYMYEWCWPDLLKHGYVDPVDLEYVGYANSKTLVANNKL